MPISDLIRTMEAIAPARYAEEWDNVGLLVGRRDTEIGGPVVLAIDLTVEVLDEACGLNASCIVAYHPPLWTPLKRLTDADPKQRIVLGAIEAGIAIYSPHTALDAAPGGVTDWLCEGLTGSEGRTAGDRRALVSHAPVDPNQELKLVTFVPPEQCERVRDALATAGAGIIGAYRDCSFSIPGRGTFLGDDSTDPAVGAAGQLETVDEIRLEMVCSRASLPLAIETLRQFHPYEEPAIDVYPLEALPRRDVGAGRRLVLDQPVSLHDLAARFRDFLGIGVVKVASASGSLDDMHSHIGVCPGAGASLAGPAGRERCSLFVTGEMRHHEVLEANAAGLSIILAGHTNTERGYLPHLRTRLLNEMPDLASAGVVVSQKDRSPLITM